MIYLMQLSQYLEEKVGGYIDKHSWHISLVMRRVLQNIPYMQWTLILEHAFFK